MKIEESKKEINKRLSKKYSEIIFSILNENFRWTVYAAILTILTKHDDFIDYLIHFFGLNFIYLLVFSIAHLISNKQEINEINFYKQLKKEIKNNINRFEEINVDELDEEIKKMLNTNNTRY